MTTVLVLSGLLVVSALFNLRSGVISAYKIGYYEEKLKNRDVDISHVKDITFREILKK